MKWTEPDPLEMYAQRRKAQDLEKLQDEVDRVYDFIVALMVAICFIGAVYFVADILL